MWGRVSYGRTRVSCDCRGTRRVPGEGGGGQFGLHMRYPDLLYLFWMSVHCLGSRGITSMLRKAAPNRPQAKRIKPKAKRMQNVNDRVAKTTKGGLEAALRNIEVMPRLPKQWTDIQNKYSKSGYRMCRPNCPPPPSPGTLRVPRQSQLTRVRPYDTRPHIHTGQPLP
jgi:hypothetical protein